MRLDVSYKVQSLLKILGSKRFFFCDKNYGNFSFTNQFLDFDRIFHIVILLKVGPDKIYAYTYNSANISAWRAAMVAEVPCNLTPRHPPSQVLDNLPRYGC